MCAAKRRACGARPSCSFRVTTNAKSSSPKWAESAQFVIPPALSARAKGTQPRRVSYAFFAQTEHRQTSTSANRAELATAWVEMRYNLALGREPPHG